MEESPARAPIGAQKRGREMTCQEGVQRSRQLLASKGAHKPPKYASICFSAMNQSLRNFLPLALGIFNFIFFPTFSWHAAPSQIRHQDRRSSLFLPKARWERLCRCRLLPPAPATLTAVEAEGSSPPVRGPHRCLRSGIAPHYVAQVLKKCSNTQHVTKNPTILAQGKHRKPGLKSDITVGWAASHPTLQPPCLMASLVGSWGASRGVWPAGRGRFSSPSALPW